MHKIVERFITIHKFLTRQLLYPLVLSSLFAFSIWWARHYIAHGTLYFYLMWNLFLAWIPYACSLVVAFLLQRRAGRWWQFILPAALWLVFLPNATYLITDLYNLEEKIGVPLWYDIGLFVTCAWSGCLLAVVSLNTMQLLIKRFFGWAASWLFVFGTVGLSGFGIYLGRFLRWNSWDVLFHPYRILRDTAMPFLHPFSNLQPIGVTLMFGALLFVFYLTFLSFQQRGATREEFTDGKLDRER